MRDLKFRAWEPDTKIMFVPTGIPNPTMSPDRTKGILMQYTGLKDKKGKEIYEGDIINFKQGETYFWGVIVATVEYNDGGFYPFADREDNAPYPKPEECEVIGNIYENPELLEATK